MEQTEGNPSEDGTTVSPTAGNLATPGSQGTAEEVAEGTVGTNDKEEPPDGAEHLCKAASEGGISGGCQVEASILEELKTDSQGEARGKEEAKADLAEEKGGKEDTTVSSQEDTGKKEETKPEPSEVTEKEEAVLPLEKQKVDEKETNLESKEKSDVNDKAEPESKEDAGAEVTVKEAETESQKKADVKDQAEPQLQEVDGKEARSDTKELVEPGSPTEEQEEQGKENESEERAAVIPSSPEDWPESPTDEGTSLSPDGLGPESTASGETSASASESSPSEVPESPTEPLPSEKKKERAPERRVSAPTRPRGPRAQNRKAIMDKFGGAASGPTALFRNTKAAGAAIGGVKNMLLEWCRAMTRNYEHVDIQNFSSSWSSGMAFCALIHKFFPDAFDYAELDPTKRRHNFTLAFSTAEKLADCAQLLEVDDMVRLAVPDSKCVYTYIQELYRSLVQKGLVKTKKK
uniref:Smoothelin-like 1 n=1 Tax=Rattus norvegicus TaxID=10116 RepID=A0A8I5ZP11_RAT